MSLKAVMFGAFALFVALGLGGCQWFSRPLEKREPSEAPPAPLWVTVVGNQDLAESLRQLTGEWESQAGYGLNIDVADALELSVHTREFSTNSDVVICRYSFFPFIAEGNQLEPIPRGFLEDAGGRWTNIFGSLRVRVLRWAEKPLAVPLGMTVFVLYLRADVLEHLGAKPPTTWQEYQLLAEKLAQSKPKFTSTHSGEMNTTNKGGIISVSKSSTPSAGENLLVSNLFPAQTPTAPEAAGGEAEASLTEPRWFGTLEPLGPGWAGCVLLARAAAYVVHRDYFSNYFSIEDMSPLIDREPFVRALEELCAAAKLGPPNVLSLTPDEVREAFWRGECGMAITWPSPTARLSVSEPTPSVTFGHLPGSPDVYDIRRSQWQKRRRDEPWQVPLLGIDGWVGVVLKTSERKSDAFQFLFWLSVEQASEFTAKLPEVTMYRSEHLTMFRNWVESPVPPPAAIEYGLLVREMLEKPVSLVCLPLPGREEYLKALDEAVAKAVCGEASPREALRAAAERWQAITDKFGRDRQLQAFKHSMNLP